MLQHTSQQPKYALRKFNIGLVSALIGTTVGFLQVSNSTKIAHADETTTQVNNFDTQNNQNINVVNNETATNSTNNNSVADSSSSNNLPLNNTQNNNLNINNQQSSANIAMFTESKIATNNTNNELAINKNGLFNSNLDNNKYQTDPVTAKADYKQGEDISIADKITNAAQQDQQITTAVVVYDSVNPIFYQTYVTNLKAGQSIDTATNNGLAKTLTINHDVLQNNHGYLAKIGVFDSQNKLISSKALGLSVEDNWKAFPRYGVIAGSGDYSNSIINNSELLQKYNQQMEEMARMHINSNFYYDVYKDPANPIPDTTNPFNQTWSWWSGKNGSTIDPTIIKKMIALGHQYGQDAMLYNMISAKTNNENQSNTPGLPDDSQLVYNFKDGAFGKQGTAMTNTMKNSDPYIAQIYYNPASKSWIEFIANTMDKAINDMGFDGWQGDTIGDNQVTTSENKGTNDSSKSFELASSYDYFVNQVKKYWQAKGKNHDLTVNAVGANGLINLAKSNEDMAYVEVWPGSTYDGYHETEYGDLKWLVDKVRQASGKSLVVAAYLKHNQPQGDKFNTDAELLVDATVAASGGYHMTIAANANKKDENNIGILDNEYYPNQEYGVSDDLNYKLYNYQQFITAYENILRGKNVENDNNIAKTFSNNGKQLSKDDNSSRESGRTGNQVWTFTKQGDGFKTIQLINLMGINSDWDNTSKGNNKTPTTQKDLTVTYPLNGMPLSQAQELAQNVYLMSPDNWTNNSIQHVQAKVINSNGHYDLAITVPELDIWDMLYLNLNPAKQQVVHYEYVNNNKILGTGIAHLNINNGQSTVDVSDLKDIPHGYALTTNAINYNPTQMLVTIPVERKTDTSSATSQSSSSAHNSSATSQSNSSASAHNSSSTSQSHSNSSANSSSTNQSHSNSSANGSSTSQSHSNSSANSSSSTSQSHNNSSANSSSTSQSHSNFSTNSSSISQSHNNSSANSSSSTSQSHNNFSNNSSSVSQSHNSSSTNSSSTSQSHNNSSANNSSSTSQSHSNFMANSSSASQSHNNSSANSSSTNQSHNSSSANSSSVSQSHNNSSTNSSSTSQSHSNSSTNSSSTSQSHNNYSANSSSISQSHNNSSTNSSSTSVASLPNSSNSEVQFNGAKSSKATPFETSSSANSATNSNSNQVNNSNYNISGTKTPTSPINSLINNSSPLDILNRGNNNLAQTNISNSQNNELTIMLLGTSTLVIGIGLGLNKRKTK